MGDTYLPMESLYFVSESENKIRLLNQAKGSLTK